ncbi:MAG: diacylglycerol kinase family lipid kinase [Actinobacteria bacterium]|nr:diacylglycerol kinase family lipid kinase [Actinomycetota bacterium]
MKEDTLVILNPAAANGSALKARQLIETELKNTGLSFGIHISESSEDIMDVTAKKIAQGYDNFISVGGDGTIHYMANVLAGTGKKLGVIPVGSGNDIAKNLGILGDIKESCRIISRCRTRKIDMGLINEKYYYLCIAGSGFDSEVNYLANNTKMPVRGPAKYSYSVYKTLITFRPKKFFLDYDGKKREVSGMMIAASNMPSYGGGMKIAPDASSLDGVFDVCIIKKMSKLHFIKVFPKVYEGKHLNDPFVEIFRTGSISMDSEYPFSVFADGEYICRLPATFRVVPGYLNFILP